MSSMVLGCVSFWGELGGVFQRIFRGNDPI